MSTFAIMIGLYALGWVVGFGTGIAITLDKLQRAQEAAKIKPEDLYPKKR